MDIPAKLPGAIAIVVQGLFEKSDSIGYDAIFQYHLLCGMVGAERVRIFAERSDPRRHPDVRIHGFGEYEAYLSRHPDALTIYHYCDGWEAMDDRILAGNRPVVVRWHNNTPPWFYSALHRNSAVRTVAGFRTILKLIDQGQVRFWVNSNFTREQLLAFGCDPARVAVVYPGSRFLDLPVVAARQDDPAEVEAPDRPLRLLFVSRVVAHKGHRHVLALAAAVQDTLGRPVAVTFPGRDDPATTLRNDLLQQAAAYGIALDLPGEIGETELREAYRAADAFVCLSEHEGFGLPVFEAMRMGVPVICWGRTALRELMADHPFALDRLDLDRAVAAVRLVAQGQARADCRAVQDAILQTYTRAVVADQIAAAIAGKGGAWTHAPLAETAAAVRLRASLDAAPQGPTHRAPQPCEAGENLVTVYDIQSYEALLSLDRGFDRLAAKDGPDDFVLLSHRDFATAGGERTAGGIAFSALPGHTGKSHVVFGPYERFVPGHFAAEFQIEAEPAGDRAAELEIDVAIEGAGILTRRRVTAGQLLDGLQPRLLFPIATNRAVVEFRIVVKRRRDCRFLFKGVVVRSAPELPRSPLSALGRLRLPRLGAIGIPFAASGHFARGDRLRDRQQWDEAAQAYARGLRFRRSFAHLVQQGNCLKEALRLEESEAAYRAALALRPDDQDAHLQLARLYRAWDKPEAMHHHLLRAARIDSASAQALGELADTGFDLALLAELYG